MIKWLLTFRDGESYEVYTKGAYSNDLLPPIWAVNVMLPDKCGYNRADLKCYIYTDEIDELLQTEVNEFLNLAN